MYKFIIDYYCERYHTGDLNYNLTRTGVVYSKNSKEAIDKLKEVDNEYKGTKNLTFEECRLGG